MPVYFANSLETISLVCNFSTHFSQAIEHGRTHEVINWLKSGLKGEVSSYVDFQEREYKSWDSIVSSKNMTALHYAAFFGQTEIVVILLEAGAGMGSHISQNYM